MRLRPLCIGTFPILIASIAQDAIHSLVWRLALGTLNPPLSSLISGSAALASMSLRNSAEKQSPESVAQQECGTCHLLT